MKSGCTKKNGFTGVMTLHDIYNVLCQQCCSIALV